MKPLRARPLLGDIAAKRLWGGEAAAQRSADILEGTFTQQRAFIEDPAKLKWALCTRRAAKSYSDGLALAKAALDHQDVSCLYIGLTRGVGVYLDLRRDRLLEKRMEAARKLVAEEERVAAAFDTFKKKEADLGNLGTRYAFPPAAAGDVVRTAVE